MLTSESFCNGMISSCRDLRVGELKTVICMGGRFPAYDGRKSIYMADPLSFTSKNITSLEDDSSGLERPQQTAKVVIKFAETADLYRLEQDQEAVEGLDIVLYELPAARYTLFGRSFLRNLERR